MVDSVALLVDATEGVMAQTKFVLRKAIGRGLRPLVVLNKVDRESARPDAVTDELFDTMVAMGVRARARAPPRCWPPRAL
jgi:GTP-binding protein